MTAKPLRTLNRTILLYGLFSFFPIFLYTLCRKRNFFYQYQQGYLDEEFYEFRVAGAIRVFAPWWKKLNIFEASGRRPSFDAEIQRILAEQER